MTMDNADRAAELEQRERDSAVERHIARTHVSRCAYCEENLVHVEPNGLHWQYCDRCAMELTAASMAGFRK